MKSSIRVVQNPSQQVIVKIPYPTEEEAQDEFDAFTADGSEYNGRLQVDLVVQHPTEGVLIRRTMFTSNCSQLKK